VRCLRLALLLQLGGQEAISLPEAEGHHRRALGQVELIVRLAEIRSVVVEHLDEAHLRVLSPRVHVQGLAHQRELARLREEARLPVVLRTRRQ
jgi:hypothetical protein